MLSLCRKPNLEFLTRTTTILLSTFLVSFVSGSLFVVPHETQAVTGLTLVPSIPSLTISAPQAVAINITPTQSDVTTKTELSVSVATTVPTGYRLTMSTTTEETALVHTSYIDPDTNTVAEIPSITTIPANPIPLTPNTWGFNVGASASTTTFRSIPPLSTPEILKSTTTSTTNDETKITIAASANTDLPSGTYTSTLQYTAATNIPTLPSPTITSITLSSGTTAGGTIITIMGTGFTANDESITSAVTVDGQSCTNVSISSNTPTVGQDTIQCTTPAHPTATSTSVAVTTWKDTIATPATPEGGFTYSAPITTITAPTAGQIFAAGTTSTTLAVTTDMDAVCYYGTATNPTTQMATTGSTSHAQTITGLTNASTNTRYVRCQAVAGHTYGANMNVTFYIKAATPTTPTLTPTSGATVNNGTTTISVVRSGATCTWGTSAATNTANASGTTRTTTTGTNTLYYRCTAGSGSTSSDARTGSWSYTGQAPKTYIQTITSSNCPTTRTRVNDARDDATYWVQKLADGECWMLTNLAYAGGGSNTYGDVKTINYGGASGAASYGYTVPYYYIPPNANKTSGTTNPSTSTDGGTSNPQYGYFYNYCAAAGVQTSTSACQNHDDIIPNINISICPSGWKLPTGNSSSSEFYKLNTAINSGSTTSDSGLLSTWLSMYAGFWNDANYGGVSSVYYWSSTIQNNIATYYTNAYSFWHQNGTVQPGSRNFGKEKGISIRCIAI